MKEPIQQSGSEVSIVIYDAPLPPRYLRFSKKFIRTLFVVVPIVLGLLIMGLLAYGIGSRVKDVPAPSMPRVIRDEEAKVQALEAEIESLKTSNVSLQEKISGMAVTPSTTSGQEEPYLMMIRKPYGMQNLLNQGRVNLDQFEFISEKNKTSLKFQIISANSENRVTGHVLVFMISGNGIVAYPAEANVGIDQGVKYSAGEPFAVSRLRPTNAEFTTLPSGDSVKFLIYIFTREGDLLLIKETESYKIGNKS
jgi:hypothetical protein